MPNPACEPSRVADGQFSRLPIQQEPQIAQTFTGEQEWLLSALMHGEFTRRDGERVGDVWEMDAPLKITRADLVASYNDHVRSYNGSPAGVRRLQTLLTAHGEFSEHRFTGLSGERPYGYVLAPRQDWRERFERDHKFRFDAESAPVPDASGELISLDQFRSAARRRPRVRPSGADSLATKTKTSNP